MKAKTPITDIFAALLEQAKDSDQDFLEMAIDAVDNTSCFAGDADKIVQSVHDAGHHQFAHFLDLLANNYFEVNISPEMQFALNL